MTDNHDTELTDDDSQTDFTTDIDGRAVHPAVTDMAEHLSDLMYVHSVLINWWKEGRLQVWCQRAHVPSDLYSELSRSEWEVRHSETRALDGVDRGYVEIVPTGFDPSEFSRAGE